MGTDLFVRFVKDWSEITEQYGDECFKNSGYSKIIADVDDTTESLFTPCCYKLANVQAVEGPKVSPIKEIVSFRGRFCEQAKNNERVIAQGKVERVTRIHVVA